MSLIRQNLYVETTSWSPLFPGGRWLLVEEPQNYKATERRLGGQHYCNSPRNHFPLCKHHGDESLICCKWIFSSWQHWCSYCLFLRSIRLESNFFPEQNQSFVLQIWFYWSNWNLLWEDISPLVCGQNYFWQSSLVAQWAQFPSVQEECLVVCTQWGMLHALTKASNGMLLLCSGKRWHC